MNLFALLLHPAMWLLPVHPAPVTIDCSTIPPEAPPVAACWTPPVVTPRPPSVTTVATVPPTVATTSTTTVHPVPPFVITGCVIKAGTDVCVSREQITEKDGATVSSTWIARVP